MSVWEGEEGSVCICICAREKPFYAFVCRMHQPACVHACVLVCVHVSRCGVWGCYAHAS